MATKTEKNKNQANEKQNDFLWRKPITLDSFDEEDPLAALYRGREVGAKDEPQENQAPKEKKKTAVEPLKKQKTQNKPASKKSSDKGKEEGSETPAKIFDEISPTKKKDHSAPKISEEELKRLLRIKSDSFKFSDIREILRGKSLDIYVFLRTLSDNTNGICKIRHLEMMEKLDISRPTLFKQSDWLVRLSLIEKQSVPGDHLGTSYTVRRAEDVLPISGEMQRQIDSFIADFQKEL